MKTKILYVVLVFSIFQCQPKEQVEETVYLNDFDQNNLTDISGGVLGEFDSDNVLGPYNNGGFELSLSNLSKHDYLELSFMLYIHDSWDGNTADPDGPDRWLLSLDDSRVMDVTFSNSDCGGTYCLFQSYPDPFPEFNNPRTGASATLPGLCHLAVRSNGTSVYNITKTIAHKGSNAKFSFYDKLVQTNTGTPACDESWSMSSIQVKQIIF